MSENTTLLWCQWEATCCGKCVLASPLLGTRLAWIGRDLYLTNLVSRSLWMCIPLKLTSLISSKKVHLILHFYHLVCKLIEANNMLISIFWLIWSNICLIMILRLCWSICYMVRVCILNLLTANRTLMAMELVINRISYGFEVNFSASLGVLDSKSWSNFS